MHCSRNWQAIKSTSALFACFNKKQRREEVDGVVELVSPELSWRDLHLLVLCWCEPLTECFGSSTRLSSVCSAQTADNGFSGVFEIFLMSTLLGSSTARISMFLWESVSFDLKLWFASLLWPIVELIEKALEVVVDLYVFGPALLKLNVAETKFSNR